MSLVDLHHIILQALMRMDVDTKQMTLLFVCQHYWKVCQGYWKVCQEQVQPSEHCVWEKRKIRQVKMNLETQREKLKEQDLSVWIIVGFLSARAINWMLRGKRDSGFILSSATPHTFCCSFASLKRSWTQLFKRDCQATLNIYMYF